MVPAGDDFLLDQIREEFDLAVLLRQAFDVHGPQLDLVNRLAQRREIDFVRAGLAVQHALLLNIERHQRKFAELRLAGDAPQHGHQSHCVAGAHGSRIRKLRREIHQNLDVQGRRSLGPLHRRLLGELLRLHSLHRPRRQGQLDLLVLGRQRRFRVPVKGANALAAVAHQPIHVIAALAQIHHAAQVGVAFGVVVDLRHMDVLHEIAGLSL